MALAETAQLVVDLRLNDQLSGGLNKAEAQLRTFGSTGGAASTAMGKLGTAASSVGGALSHAGNQLKGLITGPAGILALTGGTIGLTMAIKDTVTSATDFQQAMELIATQAGGTQAEVDAMTKGILAMATSVGTAPDQLAAGLYHIESAGLRGAKALEILKVAAQGAKVGNADLESVTNALIASVNSGVKGTTDMAGAMGVLNSIVGAGNMRMQDLASAFTTGILSSAKTFGVSIQSVGAALADMTNQGVPAQEGATRLRMTMSLLAAPTSKAAKEFSNIGLGQLDLANAMRGPSGILGAVQMLADHMRKAGLIDASGNVNSAGADLLSKAFGGGRSSSAIMLLIGSIGKLGDIQAQVTAGAGKFGDAWTKTTEDAAFQFEKFQAAIGTLAIRLGDALLPVLSDVASKAADWLGNPSNQASLVGGLNSLIGVAKSVGGAIKDFILPPLQLVAGWWNSLPGGLKELLVGGLVANKAIGWLTGTSPLKVGTNVLGGILGPLLGRVPGIGGVAAGALGVQHVWVDNMGPGFGGGGGLPEVIAAGAGGGLAGLATVTAGILGILGAYWLVQEVAKHTPEAKPIVLPQGPTTVTTTPTGTMSADQLFRSGRLQQLAFEAGARYVTPERNYYHGQSGIGFSTAAGDTYSERAMSTLTQTGHSLMSAAGRLTSAASALIHAAGLFKDAHKIFEGAGFKFSGEYLRSRVGKTLGAGDLTVADAATIALVNNLGLKETPVKDAADLLSAKRNLDTLVALQRTAPANIRRGLAADIAKLKQAINLYLTVNTSVSVRDVNTATHVTQHYGENLVVRGNRGAPGARGV